MLNVSIKNMAGQTLALSPSSAYTLFEVDGITPPKANINTMDGALLDGAIFNSATAQSRNIVLNMAINSPAETNRLNLYKYAQIKKACTLYFKNSTRNVYINGYVEAVEVDVFGKKQTAQVSVICPKPYFMDRTAQTIAFTDTGNVFTNAGDVDSGATFTVTFSSAVSSLNIDRASGGFFEIVYDFVAGDVVTITTHRGAKTALLSRNGNIINLINYIAVGSEWFQVLSGSNNFFLTAGSATVEFSPMYTGV